MRFELFIRKNPFFRLCFFYIFGILIARYYMNFPKQGIVCVFLLLLLIIYSLIRRKRSEIAGHLRGVFVFIMMLVAGMHAYIIQTKHSELPDTPENYRGIILEPGIWKNKFVHTDCLLETFRRGDSLLHLHEKVRLYIKADSMELTLSPGDSIFFFSRLQKIRNQGNPGEFDYSGYMANEGIKYSAFLNTGSYLIGGNSGRKPLYRFASGIQKQLIALFRKYGIKDNELGVISALVAGDRQYLDDSLRKSYVSAGAMHVLAVSGLHVGILYLFLNLLFGSRYQVFYYRMLKLIVILGALWFYAFITGLSTSVLRAAIMFSLFIIGKSFNRTANSYNLLAASALIILLIDPLEVFKVGFQYSYLAVAGILYFQPRLQNLIVFKWSLPDRIWQLVTVSLAAQISTFPLALFYFHQFPLYFLITNIIIIPTVWLIMIMAVVLCIISPLPALAKPFAFVLQKLLSLNNMAIEGISKLPGAMLSNIPFTTHHLIFTYLVLIMAMLLTALKIRKYIPALMAFYIIAMLSVDSVIYHRQAGRDYLLIYNLKSRHCISYVDGHKHLLITNRISPGNEDNELKYQTPFWVKNGIRKSLKRIRIEDHPNQHLSGEHFNLLVEKENYLLRVKNYTLVYLSKGGPYPSASIPEADQKTVFLIDKFSGFPSSYSHFSQSPDQIIIARNTPAYLQKAWIKHAGENFYSIYSMDNQGAMRLEF